MCHISDQVNKLLKEEMHNMFQLLCSEKSFFVCNDEEFRDLRPKRTSRGFQFW